MDASIYSAVGGGVIIGLAASWFMLAVGRIAGISGIMGGLVGRWDDQAKWRASFIVGMLSGGILLALWAPQTLVAPTERSLPLVALAGILVGFGTQLGRGCTSGHGICGLTRRSPRSVVATFTFMVTGIVSATVLGVIG